MVTMIIAISATVVNYVFVRSQTAPDIVIYADVDDRRPSIIILVVQNVGRSVARNVRFDLPEYFPQKAFGIGDAPRPEPMTSGTLVNGIPALPAGCRRVLTWGQYAGLHRAIGDEAVSISVHYQGDRLGPFQPMEFSVSFPVDIASLLSVDNSDQNWDRKSCEQLGRIAKSLEKLEKGDHG